MWLHLDVSRSASNNNKPDVIGIQLNQCTSFSHHGYQIVSKIDNISHLKNSRILKLEECHTIVQIEASAKKKCCMMRLR